MSSEEMVAQVLDRLFDVMHLPPESDDACGPHDTCYGAPTKRACNRLGYCPKEIACNE